MKKSYVMNRVSILTYKGKIIDVCNLLYDLKLIEFFESSYANLNSIDKSDVEVESEELVSIRSAISQIKPYFTQASGAYSNNSIEQIHVLINKKQDCKQKLIQAKDFKLRDKVKKNLKLTSKEIEKGFIGYVEKNNEYNLSEYKKEFKQTRTFEFNNRVYFYTNIKPIFSFKEYFIPLNLSKQYSQKELEDDLKYINTELKNIANSNLRHLQAQELKLSKEVEVEKSKEYFKESNKFVVIEGFVPAHKTHELDIALRQKLADSYEIEVENIKEVEENVPVMLPNKGLMKSFEDLISFYSFPKYREIDPSILMLIFFPIFFGLILGDVGYGTLTLLIFSALKFKFPDMKNLFSVMQLSSISSILFGILYGEYFGYEPKLFPFEFHRVDYPETMLIIALLFGLLHINIGYIVGIMNNINKSVKKVFTDYVSWIILQIAIAALYFGYTSQLTSLVYSGYLGVLITLVLLYIGHGLQGVIEITSIFTNIMSYARLMAVGISSVVIAVLINEFSFPLFQGNIISIFFGIILITTAHTFNMVLGNFESFLQALRLHYVEFFSKFYEGGGREFNPFGSKIREE